jgi:nucleotide sugar dehydrogenase
LTGLKNLINLYYGDEMQQANINAIKTPRQRVNMKTTETLKLGVIGRGFVGGAVSNGFNTKKVEQYTVDPRFSNLTLEGLVEENPQVTFICLPTPTRTKETADGPVGSVNADLIKEALQKLQTMEYDGIVVIKSTVAPSVLDAFVNTYTQLNIVYNPEFLTEANANDDFINPPFQIFGGDWDTCTKVEQMYTQYSNVKPVPTFKLDIKAASFLKYTINSWLATKVVFFNELRELYAEYDMTTPWSEFIGVLSHEPRVGPSHMNVPGPDGKFGFGGNCFPKDTKAFVEESRNFSMLQLLEKAIQLNNEMRIDN